MQSNQSLIPRQHYQNLPESHFSQANSYDHLYHEKFYDHAPSQQQLADDNYLVQMATPLLTLITQIRHTVAHPNVTKLRAQIIEEIKLFQQRISRFRYPMETVLIARYCLCTAVDEAVLGRPWGNQSVWTQNSLLNIFHKETWGGERFYILLEKMSREPKRHIDFLELAYFILSLGFEGKFFGSNIAVREDIRNRIFYQIRNARQKPEKILSYHWRDENQSEKNQQRKTAIKKTLLVSISVVIFLILVFNILVYENAAPVLSKLKNIADVSPVTTFSEVVQRSIFGE